MTEGPKNYEYTGGSHGEDCEKELPGEHIPPEVLAAKTMAGLVERVLSPLREEIKTIRKILQEASNPKQTGFPTQDLLKSQESRLLVEADKVRNRLEIEDLYAKIATWAHIRRGKAQAEALRQGTSLATTIPPTDFNDWKQLFAMVEELDKLHSAGRPDPEPGAWSR